MYNEGKVQFKLSDEDTTMGSRWFRASNRENGLPTWGLDFYIAIGTVVLWQHSDITDSRHTHSHLQPVAQYLLFTSPTRFDHRTCPSSGNYKLLSLKRARTSGSQRANGIKCTCWCLSVIIHAKIALPFLDLGTRRGWMVSTTPRPLYPRERPGTHCTGGWVGPRADLNV
jgi:hypothetical protein